MALPPEGSKGFLVILGFAFAVEGALYSAVTPILPLLSRQFDMSDTQAGIMLSSYSAGLIAGSLLCVLVLRRINARNAAISALTLLALSSLAFAWAESYDTALTTRLVQGIAGGATWTACISWLLRLWPNEKRGEALGLAMGPAVVGTVAGPAIGTVAVESGVGIPYTVVAVLCGGAAAWLLRMPRPSIKTDATRAVTAAKRKAPAMFWALVATVSGALIGLVNLAGPMILVGIGAAERTAGIVFVIAAIATVIASRFLGRMVDRKGAARTAAFGLLVMSVALPPFGAGSGIYVTGALVVVLILANNLCYISAGTLLTHEGERAGWSLSFVTALTATVWGIGETAGALLAGIGLDRLGALWTTAGGGVIAASIFAAVAVAAVLIGRTVQPSQKSSIDH
ncbi:MFS transporter [Rhodococcus enclensis]|nr:MFS transporter [Rhodococcus qingshengii]